MKSAEEYVKGFDRFIDLKTEIKQIQLDAMKEGARRAAQVCEKHPDYADMRASNYIDAILTTAEQWTLNELWA